MQGPATQAPAGGSAAKSESTEHQTPGAMSGALKGNINGSGAAKSAQAPAQGTKPDQQLGQDQEKQMTPQRGSQEDKSGAQEQQRGAQDEKRGTEEQRGAQQENTKSGVNADEQNASKTKGPGGGAVQLSQTQRSKIQAVIGRSHAARVTTNVNVDVAVGVKIPRSVHVEVLPEDVVEIVPQFEGFDYIVVGDNILIIDPDTLEIVDVIPV
jgi:hypothetical protein